MRVCRHSDSDTTPKLPALSHLLPERHPGHFATFSIERTWFQRRHATICATERDNTWRLEKLLDDAKIRGRFETGQLSDLFDVTAPDGSGIRILPKTTRGSMAHGTLAPTSVSLAIRHQTVDEIWFVLAGAAEIWRRLGDQSSTELVKSGYALTIPQGTEFQFRTVGTEPFEFIMCTMPPWPGPEEAVLIDGPW